MASVFQCGLQVESHCCKDDSVLVCARVCLYVCGCACLHTMRVYVFVCAHFYRVQSVFKRVHVFCQRYRWTHSSRFAGRRYPALNYSSIGSFSNLINARMKRKHSCFHQQCSLSTARRLVIYTSLKHQLNL